MAEMKLNGTIIVSKTCEEIVNEDIAAQMRKKLLNNIEMAKCAQLDMLCELKRLCEKNDIPYFLVAGTLIGAIRHNGFIPWDDDIDVGMLRENYERFIKIAEIQLDTDYVLHNWNKDSASPLPFLKIKIKGTHYTEESSKDTQMDDKIFIDIFPYDNAPNSKFKRRVQSIQIYLIKKILMLRYGFSLSGNSMMKKILYSILNFLSKVKSKEKWKKTCEKVMRKYNGKKVSDVVSMCQSFAYHRKLKNKAILEELTHHTFEGIEFSIPKDYDIFLSDIYGDYMKLPPESDRVSRHGISFVDLGHYKIRHLINKSTPL